MKLLIDTHIFLWLMTDPNKLSKTARDACMDVENNLYLSVASLWEIQIKTERGKLHIDIPLQQIVTEQSDKFEVLPITANHILALNRLPTHHNDPFDRMLIAQALTEEAYLISADQVVQQYANSINLVW